MRRPLRNGERLEFLVYLRAVPLLVMNPILLLAPLLVSIVDQVLAETIGGGLAQFCIFMLDTFGLAISIIAADMIWRRGRASFDEAWDDARRKAGDILMAAIGLNFVIFVAGYGGSILSPYLGIICTVAAVVFLIYTVAAAALSGVPGSAALQKSIDIVRASPVNAIVLTIVTIAAYWWIGTYLPLRYFLGFGTISLVIQAVFKALALGYISLIMAQRFSTLNFYTPRVV